MLWAFVLVNKVFSPQYIVWLIPFVALAERRVMVLFFVIAALTIYVYPFHWQEFTAGRLVPVLALNVRNLLGIGLLVMLVTRTAKTATEKSGRET